MRSTELISIGIAIVLFIVASFFDDPIRYYGVLAGFIVLCYPVVKFLLIYIAAWVYKLFK